MTARPRTPPRRADRVWPAGRPTGRASGTERPECPGDTGATRHTRDSGRAGDTGAAGDARPAGRIGRYCGRSWRGATRRIERGEPDGNARVDARGRQAPSMSVETGLGPQSLRQGLSGTVGRALPMGICSPSRYAPRSVVDTNERNDLTMNEVVVDSRPTIVRTRANTSSRAPA